MTARIALVILIVLIVLSGIGETFSNSHLEQINLIVQQAVEDNSWVNAQSQEELNAFFAKIFTAELSQELVAETWPYFENPTSFTHQAAVTTTKTIVLGQSAFTIAALELYNTGDNSPQLEGTGTGFFHLVINDDKQWQINKMEFDWVYLD